MQIKKDQSITEINTVIAKIQETITPECEIGALASTMLSSKLSMNNIERKKVKTYKCKRDHSDKIVQYFVKEKGIKKNKFSMNLQDCVYVIFP
jgi:hypothetical protein